MPRATHATVVRLKGGDPMLFGRAQEEIAALEAAGVPYAVVPGVTAALAAAADIGTSLTQRGGVRSFAFATPRVGAGEPPSRWLDGILRRRRRRDLHGRHDAPAIAAALVNAGALRKRRSQSSRTPRCRARVHYTTLDCAAGLPVRFRRSDAAPRRTAVPRARGAIRRSGDPRPRRRRRRALAAPTSRSAPGAGAATLAGAAM